MDWSRTMKATLFLWVRTNSKAWSILQSSLWDPAEAGTLPEITPSLSHFTHTQTHTHTHTHTLLTLSCPASLCPSTVSPRNTSLINHLHTNPCLRVCFWATWTKTGKSSDSFLFLFFFNFIYLFLVVLGLRFCARAFSSCGKRGPLFIAVRGPLTVAASLAAEHRLQTRRLSSCSSRA